MKMTNKTYDTLKKISWLLLPITTLAIAIINVITTEGITPTSALLGIMTAVESFLGYILDESNRKYNEAMQEEQTDE